MAIKTGTLLDAVTASGAHVRMRAIGAPTDGFDFPVVWVCTEREYERARGAGEDPHGLPWPLNAVAELRAP